MTSLYAVLGVDQDADAATIRRAYRELARRHHPDFGGDTDQMTSINEAWHVLGNAERRASYNRQLRWSAPRPVSRDGTTVMDFGRYEGWSLGDIAKLDENYLLWLSRMTIGRPLRKEISEVLAKRSAEMEARHPTHTHHKRRRGLFSR